MPYLPLSPLKEAASGLGISLRLRLATSATAYPTNVKEHHFLLKINFVIKIAIDLKRREQKKIARSLYNIDRLR